MFLALNFNYFWANARFLLSNRTTSYQDPKALSARQTEHRQEPNLLAIESLGIKAPIVYIDKTSETEFQMALKNGVVHYPGTAKPGEAGNVYIFGHSSDFVWTKGNYKSVFALLPKIKIGAAVSVTDQDGTPFVYKVTRSFVASAKDTYLLKQDQTQKILTLQTSYPIGTALKRYIVIAKLEE